MIFVIKNFLKYLPVIYKNISLLRGRQCRGDQQSLAHWSVRLCQLRNLKNLKNSHFVSLTSSDPPQRLWLIRAESETQVSIHHDALVILDSSKVTHLFLREWSTFETVLHVEIFQGFNKGLPRIAAELLPIMFPWWIDHRLLSTPRPNPTDVSIGSYKLMSC